MTKSPPPETDTPETDAAIYEHQRRIWTVRTACKSVYQVVVIETAERALSRHNAKDIPRR